MVDIRSHFLTGLFHHYHRRGAKYQLMNDRVSDPAYLANVQAQLYPGALRPGPPHHTQYSDQATAVEARPRPFRPTHVP